MQMKSMNFHLRTLLIVLVIFLSQFGVNAQGGGYKPSGAEIMRWEKQAKAVTIIRDKWGVPHIYGKTDADAVFGLLYAQCEDDFKRVEMNYVEKLGRLSELKGEIEWYNDLLIRLLIDTADAKQDYQKAEPWLKSLLNAYADGINYYLFKNPQANPRMLTHFEPWFPLLWTDGSIGAIGTADITTTDLKNFYNSSAPTAMIKEPEPTGSNGFAFSSKITASGNAILYINPHVTFYFRPEVHAVSEQGLNAYGAVTWGQFFIYQGFNPYCGWMHTSSSVDVADGYEENVIQKDNGKFFYKYEGAEKPLTEKQITIAYRDSTGVRSRTITAYYTHHGPVMAKRNGKWISLRSFNRSMTSLKQSWLRTKAKGFEEYKKVMDLKANTSNNTVFADYKGNIAYWHGNFVPVRDKNYDWSKPVDGSTSKTEWKGLHSPDQTVHSYNPPNGWLQNCNSTPFTVAGKYSPKRSDYPAYMAPDGENFRGINAVRVLSSDSKYTIDKVIAAGYDRHLSAFDVLIPALEKALTTVDLTDSFSKILALPINELRAWDRKSSANSVATTLAVEWAQKLGSAIQRVYIAAGEDDQVEKTKQFAATATASQLLNPLAEVVDELTKKFGTWKIAWGEINRFQRTTGDLQEKYDDNAPSFPVGFASATWGQLPSYNSRNYPGTKKRYGVSGNSFICAVEFGKRIKAKSLLAGGESGHPGSKHFFDQGEMYANGIFKDVLFYKEDVMKHVERKYHPGE
jgi:acyl-homoserine-lactone acylase